MNCVSIAATQFANLQGQGQARYLIDVRSPAEYRAGHVIGARNVPLDTLAPEALAEQLRSEGLQDGDAIFILCQTGNRARTAAEQLQRVLPRVTVVEGGTEACQACGLPVERSEGRQVISLQRQVQISAGSLILLGMALGTWVAPAWYGLSAFVGAGLVFAGLSGTCGMALLLARMPWNH